MLCSRSYCRVLNEGDDLKRNMQRWDLKRASLSLFLWASLSILTSAVQYIYAQKLVVWIRPVIIHSVRVSKSLCDCRHKCSTKQLQPQWHHIYSLNLLLLAAVWVIRCRSVVDHMVVFFTAESDSTKTAKVRFSCSVCKDSQFCQSGTLLHSPLLSLLSNLRNITQTLHLDR